jgi:hypothetical protein
MNYTFNHLSPDIFENLIQSLSRKILGNSTLTFGAGPDGGREATFEGMAPFPSEKECWQGKWIIQAKFRNRPDSKTDFNWVKKEFKQEMGKFESRKVKVKLPDNYLFFTNVVLTPVAKTGGRDKMEELVEHYTDKIKNIKLLAYDDLCGFLENNRDVATSYASFILPGDILISLYDILKKSDAAKKNHHNLLGRFLEAEFREDLSSKLEHAGKLTNDKINLEKVFVDLYATPDGQTPKDKDNNKKFLELCLEEGNSLLRQNTKTLRYVLIGGPGYGKSTITQFLCQVYRAHFLKTIDSCSTILPEAENFLQDLDKIIPVSLTCSRFPFRIALKNFAEWINKQKTEEKPHTLLLYLKYRIEKRGHGDTIEIEELLKSLSFVFTFDGLDEVPAASNREEVLSEINNFIDIDLRRYNCDAMIAATTRPQGYTKEFASSKYTHLTITDLEKEDCLAYLDRLLKNIGTSSDEREKQYEILEKALDDNIVSRLMKSPLQASIMAILVKSGGEPPKNKYDLFTEYYRTIFRREQQKDICRILNEYGNYIDDIHYKLGFHLQLSAEFSENPSSYLSTEEFEDLVFSYLKNQGFEDKEAGFQTQEILQATTQRLVFLTETEERKIGFSIRSIQEYFAANYYCIHQPDEIILKRLRYMCKSSYWRNTFLFALGYIYNHKNYIIDSVESICHELNGSTDEPGIISGSAACKLGSWLALDILNEGIFRGSPKFENKFANLLENLFTISPTYKFSNFGYLSEEIKQKWVLTFLEKYISRGTFNKQFTCWTIGIYLLKYNFTPVTALFDKHWPNDKNEVRLTKHFIKLNAYSNGWFINKFLTVMKNHPPFTFFKQLYEYKFLNLLASSTALDLNVRKTLIQNLFCLNISRNFMLPVDRKLFNIISDNKFFKDAPSKEIVFINKNILHSNEDFIKFYFFNKNIVIETFSIKTTNKELPILNELLSEFKIHYLVKLTDFLKAPNKKKLKRFIEELKNESEETIKTLKEIFRNINWLFLIIFFNTNENLEHITQNIDNNKYGDENDWIDTEKRAIKGEVNHNTIKVLDKSEETIMSNITQAFKVFFKNHYLRINNNTSPELKEWFQKELTYLAEDSIFSNFDNFDDLIIKNKIVIDELLYSIKQLKPGLYSKKNIYFTIFYLIGYLPQDEIINFLNDMEKSIGEYRLYQANYKKIKKGKVISVIHKLSIILNNCLTTEIETPIIRVLVDIILNKNLPEEYFPLTKIDFETLQKTTFKKPENEASSILLCLLDPQMNPQKSCKILKTAKTLYQKVPVFFERILVIVEKFNLKEKWVEHFLVEIYKMVDKSNHDVKSQYENYLKDMLESNSSHLNEGAVQKELALIG